tara:strand:+ start:844 stop:1107 length:264 start_codon:yes stop_codon:yes gene_type:complete
MQQMIIANELRSGEVVFLSEEGNWVTNIDKATVALDIDQANKLLTLAQEAEHNNKVVGAELVEIEAQDKQRFPKDIREAIRVNGPTV